MMERRPLSLTFNYKWILLFFPGDRNEPRPAYLVVEKKSFSRIALLSRD